MEQEDPDDMNVDKNIKRILVRHIMSQVNSKHDIYHLLTKHCYT